MQRTGTRGGAEANQPVTVIVIFPITNHRLAYCCTIGGNWLIPAKNSSNDITPSPEVSILSKTC